MKICTIEIEYQEPYTGVWVRGRNEYFFRNEKELKETLDRWRKVLTEKYGEGVIITDLTSPLY